MIAGRLRWKERGEKLPAKVGLAAFDFPNGTLIFTEASPKKRASLHLVAGRAGLAEFDRGGLDVLTATTAAVRRAAAQRAPHGEALAHRSDAVRRHRQRVLRRDPARGEAVAVPHDVVDDRRRDRARCTRVRSRTLTAVDAAAARRGRRRVPRQGHRVPARDGGARQVRRAVPGVRHARSSASSTPTTRRTTARPARPKAGCSPTARCRACSRRTGRKTPRGARGAQGARATDACAERQQTTRGLATLRHRSRCVLRRGAHEEETRRVSARRGRSRVRAEACILRQGRQRRARPRRRLSQRRRVLRAPRHGVGRHADGQRPARSRRRLLEVADRGRRDHRQAAAGLDPARAEQRRHVPRDEAAAAEQGARPTSC